MPASTNQVESDQQFDPVRQLAAAGLRQLGANDDEIASIAEIILLSGGYYVGRRFECASREAVWMIDRDEVCFYQLGELVTSIGMPRHACTSCLAQPPRGVVTISTPILGATAGLPSRAKRGGAARQAGRGSRAELSRAVAPCACGISISQ